jgi:hypothetical protein
VAALLSASPRPAQADDALAAEAAFAEARSLMARGRYADACPKLEASYRLDPALGTLMNLGECMQRTGKTASAWVTFRRAAAEALRVGQPARETIARDRARALESRLCRVVLKSGGTPPFDGLTVSRDDASPEAIPFDVAVPVDPGEHTFEFAASGRQPATVRVDVAPPPADSTCPQTTVTVPALVAKAAAAPASDGASESSPDRLTAQQAIGSSRWQTSHSVALTTAALGLVSLAVAAGFGIDAMAANAAGNAKCTPQGCTGEGLATLHGAGRSADVATVLASTGAVAVAAGVVLWLLAPSLRAPPTAALRF